MKISRANVDFGNSIFMTLMDGYYFEMPTNVVELQSGDAEGFFAAPVEDKNDLLKRMMISFKDGEKERFFLVGELAEQQISGNQHINKLHNKVESIIPYVTFLAACAYYHELKAKEGDNEVQIEAFSTMLPIWLLKRESKFSEMQQKMADRFSGEHSVNIRTHGLEKELKISVGSSVCRNEGEVARWAIKKDIHLEDNPAADQFKEYDVVLNDIGGGTIDQAFLPKGLKAPRSRDDMNFFADAPYLGYLEELRKDKLLDVFENVRELEMFIVHNYNKTKMQRKDGNSGKTYDLTDTIKSALKKYAQTILPKIEEAFSAPMDKVYKYVYIGGEAPILEESIKEVISGKYSPEIAETNHIFLPEARKLNLLGLEILSLDMARKTAQNAQ